MYYGLYGMNSMNSMNMLGGMMPPMPGMYNFGMGSSDTMLGYQLAFGLVGAGVTVCKSVQAEKASNPENTEEGRQKKLDDIDAKLDVQYKILGSGINADNYLDAKVDESFDTKIKEAGDAFTAAESAHTTASDYVKNNKDEYDKLCKSKAAYEKACKTPEDKRSDEQKKTIAEYEATKTQTEDFIEEYKQNQTALPELLKAKNNAEDMLEKANQAKKDEETKFENAKNEIKKLLDDRKKIVAKIENNALDKANGNVLTRTKDDKYKEYLDANGNLKEGSYTKRDFKAAVDRYMDALDGKDKYIKAKNVVKMYRLLPTGEISGHYKTAAEYAGKYVTENKDKYESKS